MLWRKVFGLLLPSRRKCLFNLLRDVAQPFLGALRAVYVTLHLRFEFGNSVFGDPKLHGRLMSYCQRMLDTLLRGSGSVSKFRQYILTSPVQTVGSVGELDDF
jgi:hypothetical protein